MIFAGVGGQGGLSASAIIANAAKAEGFFVKQTEVHGMSQRGGAVQASLRISDRPVESPIIPRGTASLLMSMEPLESLRYLEFLAPNARIFTATSPVRNISDYPDLDLLLGKIREIPGSVLIDADGLAREAGSLRSANIAVLGALSTALPFQAKTLEHAIETLFTRKGKAVVETNLKAFQLGRSLGSDPQ